MIGAASYKNGTGVLDHRRTKRMANPTVTRVPKVFGCWQFQQVWPSLYEEFHERWPEEKVLWPMNTPSVLTDIQKKELGWALHKHQKVSRY